MVAKSEPNIVLSNQEFNVVGTRPIRHDGADKVTGRARYSADVYLPGMLYGISHTITPFRRSTLPLMVKGTAPFING